MGQEAEPGQGQEIRTFPFRVYRFDDDYREGLKVEPWKTVLLMHILPGGCALPTVMALWLTRDIGMVVSRDGKFSIRAGESEAEDGSVSGEVFQRLPEDLESQYLSMDWLKKMRN